MKFVKKLIKDRSRFYPLIFTLAFVIIMLQYSFSTLESVFYDSRVRFDFGIDFRDDIVLITMDEESEEFLGEKYPYTFASHNRMLGRLIKDKPTSLGYLVSFGKLESEASFKGAKRFSDLIEGYVSGGGYFKFGTRMDPWGEQVPPEQLQQLGYRLAQINVDSFTFSNDGVARRAILKVSGEDSLHLDMANHFRQGNNLQRLHVEDIAEGSYRSDADAIFALFRYYTDPARKNSRIKRIPFHRVVVGNFPKGYFSNKIVLIGSTYISRVSDHSYSPFDRTNSKIENLAIHAAIIESMAQDKFVQKVPRIYSWVFSIFIALVLSIVILKLSPVRGLVITLAALSGVIILSFFAFSAFGLWIYMTYPLLAICVVYYVSVPFRAVEEYQQRFAMQEETSLIKRVEGLKRNFLSLMSHDLKTPVAKIAGIADIMMQQSSSPSSKENLGMIVDSTKELNKFITAILDLTKIESESIIINKSSKDINKIIEDSVESLRFEAKKALVEVDLELSPLYPIDLDTHLMKRVISNLVENAIKYSGEGSTVSVKSYDDEKWVYVQIKDNGIGISAEDIAHIFDKFYRVRNDSTHSIKGSGLGLYLVKYFVDLHGGKIEVSSAESEGTTFTIQLRNV